VLPDGAETILKASRWYEPTTFTEDRLGAVTTSSASREPIAWTRCHRTLLRRATAAQRIG
jgi:hypothetical protein